MQLAFDVILVFMTSTEDSHVVNSPSPAVTISSPSLPPSLSPCGVVVCSQLGMGLCVHSWVCVLCVEDRAEVVEGLTS